MTQMVRYTPMAGTFDDIWSGVKRAVQGSGITDRAKSEASKLLDKAAGKIANAAGTAVRKELSSVETQKIVDQLSARLGRGATRGAMEGAMPLLIGGGILAALLILRR